MIPEIGPNPRQYTAQPQVYGMHRYMYELLGGRVATHLGVPILPRERQQDLEDAFERVRTEQADEPNPQRPDAIGRLFAAVSQRLRDAGLLPPRETQAADESMAGHSHDVAAAINRFGLVSQRFWHTMEDTAREAYARSLTSSDSSPGGVIVPIPEGLFVIGRHPMSTVQINEADVSKVQLSGQFNGNHLVLRDGFYPFSKDLSDPLENLPAWRGSKNGSFYFDEALQPHRIPADRPIVLPNAPVYIMIGSRRALQLDNQGLKTIPGDIEDVLQTNAALMDTDANSARLTEALGGLMHGPKRRLTIGREEDSDFVLNEPRASRAHARINYAGGQFTLVDLESTNGTRIRRVGIAEPITVDTAPATTLEPGDEILIGRSILRFNPPQATS